MLPQLLVRSFSNIPDDSLENRNGIWNLLLVEFFPWKEGWVITPLCPDRFGIACYATIFMIEHYNATTPAVLVELCPFFKLRSIEARSDLDTRMRLWFADCMGEGPEKLIGLSAFGHMVCKYEATKVNDKYEVIPPVLPMSPNRVYDNVPKERWDLDLLTDEGGDRLVAIIKEVKNVIFAEIAT